MLDVLDVLDVTDPTDSLGEAEARFGGAGAATDVPSEPEEHPDTAKANRQVSPAAGLRKPRIKMHPLS